MLRASRRASIVFQGGGVAKNARTAIRIEGLDPWGYLDGSLGGSKVLLVGPCGPLGFHLSAPWWFLGSPVDVRGCPRGIVGGLFGGSFGYPREFIRGSLVSLGWDPMTRSWGSLVPRWCLVVVGVGWLYRPVACLCSGGGGCSGVRWCSLLSVGLCWCLFVFVGA